ncbi:MAG: bifunctional acetate--CoA ligase family protein/GNAT family N-acetyltransferase [Candidatus Competibacteraceae bacterium]|nr:bifunctional acetate--CoA ligase family protein/GNAT family N-acetyltransferase [Candidatus Competibacteraceae bacterium]
MTIRNLEYLFKPRSIAVIGRGKQPDGPDAAVEFNLIEGGFKGPVMPVNPDQRSIAGVLAYPNIASLPVSPDLAILTTPLDEAPALIDELGQRGTRAVLLLSREVLQDHRGAKAALLSQDMLRKHPDDGEVLKQKILDTAKPYLLRIMGPDHLGYIAPSANVNASLSGNRPLAGHIALLCQSAAVMRSVIDWATSRNIGFSHVISVGIRWDVDFGDLLDYLLRDYQTRAILMYMENTRNRRKFVSAARVAARVKPVIVLKPHDFRTGPVEDAVYDAVFQRAGILRVDSIEQLFSAAETLATARPVYSDRLTIVSNSYSLALMTSDTLLRYDGHLAEISAATRERVAQTCRPGHVIENPVDLGDTAGPDQYGQSLDLLLREPGADGVLVIHAPASTDRSLDCAQAVTERAAKSRRLVMTCWLGESSAEPARELFKNAQIPTYEAPDEAVEAFMRLAQYRRNQELLMETPPSVPEEFTADAETARRIIQIALTAGRRRLNAYEASQVLSAYEIPVVPLQFASTPEAATDIALELGMPVALKILSPDIVNKSDVGGVAFSLKNPLEVLVAATEMLNRVRDLAPEAVIDGFAVQPMHYRHNIYELMMGVRTGKRFGPVIFFGQGGTEAGVIDDVAYALPPLNMQLARDLIWRTRLYRRLSTNRGRPVDLDAIALTLLKISQMVVDLAEVVELDINPIWLSSDGLLALDANVVIEPSAEPAAKRLAILPYPKQMERRYTLPDGRSFLMRPILPEDEPELQNLVKRMPAEDVRMRFFQPIHELSHEMAARLTQLDYEREMAIIVTDPDAIPGKGTIWGVVRCNADPDLERAEYAILVDRAMIGIGLGPMLMRYIIEYARQQGIKEIYGEVLRENESMLRLNRALNFKIEATLDDPGVLHVKLSLV